MSFYTRSGRKVRMNRRYQDPLFDTELPRIQPEVVPFSPNVEADDKPISAITISPVKTHNKLFLWAYVLWVIVVLSYVLYYLDNLLMKETIKMIGKGHLEAYQAFPQVVYPWDPKQFITILLKWVHCVTNTNRTEPLYLQ